MGNLTLSYSKLQLLFWRILTSCSFRFLWIFVWRFLFLSLFVFIIICADTKEVCNENKIILSNWNISLEFCLNAKTAKENSHHIHLVDPNKCDKWWICIRSRKRWFDTLFQDSKNLMKMCRDDIEVNPLNGASRVSCEPLLLLSFFFFFF